MKDFVRTLAALSFGCACFLAAGCGGSSSSGSQSSPSGPTPTVSSISPAKVQAGASATAVTVNGSNFTSSTVVQVGTAQEQTTYVSSSQVTVSVPANQLANGGMLPVIAQNGDQSSAAGTAVNLEIDNPAPVISSVMPAALTFGQISPTAYVAGTGFVPSTVVDVNGSARTTLYVSPTQVDVFLTASDVGATATLSLTANNGTPGGGASTAISVPVVNPVPTIASISPQTVLTTAKAPVTVTITGTNFVPTSTVQLSGISHASTYVSSTQLTLQLSTTDLASEGQSTVTVTNPAPGGGIGRGGALSILPPSQTPVLTSVSPTAFVVGSGATTITVSGENFAELFPVSGGFSSVLLTSTILWNGTPLTTTGLVTSGGPAQAFTAQVPASLLTTAGTASITVSSSTATPAVSNAMSVTIGDPPAPTLTSLSPSSGAIGMATTISLTGTGFTPSSTVTLNGNAVTATYVSPSQLNVSLATSDVNLPGNLNFVVTTPAPGGGTSNALAYTAYIPIANNSMVYNPVNGLFYLSVPSSAGAPYGNSVVSVDPATGALGTPIPVGSEPDRLAVTADGNFLWVALDGASAVRKVNLSTGTAGLQFGIGNNSGIYATPPTVSALAALPGATDSVFVGTGNSLAIYDAGTMRGTNINTPADALQADGTRNEVYAANYNGYNVYTYSNSGLTLKASASGATSGSYYTDDLQIAGGKTYTDNGQVLDSESGALLGTLYASNSIVAQGPAVADTLLGNIFVLDNAQGYATSYGYTQIQAFNSSTYAQVANSIIPVGVAQATNSTTTIASHLTRWGANGLAFRTQGGVYSLRSNAVKDLSSTNADLSVAMASSGDTTTGAQTTYTATVTNSGPSGATNIALVGQLPANDAVVSVTPSAGTCSFTGTVTCSLGNLANGATATVSMVVTQTAAGTATASVQVTGSENDLTPANNQASANVTVTGSNYNLTPTLSSISPAAIASGAADTAITILGSGFSSSSQVQLGSVAIATTYTDSSHLTATIPSAQLANLGWAAVSVVNPAPGGGSSNPLPLTVYSVLTVGVNHILYDPYSRKIMASVGSGSSSINGNSIAAITPETATVGTPVAIGSQPGNMALTSDGQILYTVLNGSQSVARFNMLTQQADFTYAVPQAGNGTIRGIAAQPGTENTIALDLGSWTGNALYDFDPVHQTAAIRGQATGPYTGSCIQFVDANDMVAFDIDTSGATFNHYAVPAGGFSYYNYSQFSESTLLHFGCFKLSGGLAFANLGGVANPTTTPATQLAWFPVSSSGGYNSAPLSFVPDASLRQAFYLGTSQTEGADAEITAFDTGTYMPSSVLPMNLSATEGNTTYAIVDVIRWGQDGLAILTNGSHIYLLRGAAVVPGLMYQNGAASLTTSSVSSIPRGTGNTLLTLTGANFAPGVAVTWNGAYRTTTVVDATHVTVAIPASDLATTGTASLLATNPGAAASSPLAITVN